MHIVQPGNVDKTVHIDQISKKQLASALNEQSKRFQEFRVQFETVQRILMAIVTEPEALTHSAGGVATLALEAFNRVQDGAQLRVQAAADTIILSMVTVEQAADVPRIVIP